MPRLSSVELAYILLFMWRKRIVYNCRVCEAEFLPFGASARYCPNCSPFVKRLQACVASIVELARLPRAWKSICVDCGNAATDNDHRYYERPLFVEYVCRGCNVRRGQALDVQEMTKKLMLSKAHHSVSVKTWCDWELGRTAAPEGAVKLFKLLNEMARIRNPRIEDIIRKDTK